MKFLNKALLIIVLLFAVSHLWAEPTNSLPEAGPVIDVWYGRSQRFGHIGKPQRWVNILGNVSDVDGVKSLAYSLNGGEEKSLSIGPDTRRLGLAGDFNIDILRNDLNQGENAVLIKAVDKVGIETVTVVVVNYEGDKTWPLPYSIKWDEVTNIQDVAEVVDGKWIIEADGVRAIEANYDRLIAIGDLKWRDYRVTVPITINSVDIKAGPVSGGPALGVLMRWTGHTDNPRAGWQPKAGWVPNGAIGWWRAKKGEGLSRLEFYKTDTLKDFVPKVGVKYIFKLEVESLLDRGSVYKIKVWEDGQAEPANWDLVNKVDAPGLGNGSLLLIAHHVDATYGDVTVEKVKKSGD